ncbi:hypothetical protein IMSAGC016_00720 [Muribaculaceae bacterium]|jgi:hypothetical protein|nr:hypothetical protein IMSAGC016_00720 [Muribaculaceae bacterium]
MKKFKTTSYIIWGILAFTAILAFLIPLIIFVPR